MVFVSQLHVMNLCTSVFERACRAAEMLYRCCLGFSSPASDNAQLGGRGREGPFTAEPTSDHEKERLTTLLLQLAQALLSMEASDKHPELAAMQALMVRKQFSAASGAPHHKASRECSNQDCLGPLCQKTLKHIISYPCGHAVLSPYMHTILIASYGCR